MISPSSKLNSRGFLTKYASTTMKRCYFISQFSIFSAGLGLLALIMSPKHAFALAEHCASGGENEPYTKANYLLEPPNFTNCPHPDTLSPLWIGNIQGPDVSQFSDAAHKPELTLSAIIIPELISSDTISVGPIKLFPNPPVFLVLSSEQIQIEALPGFVPPPHILEQSEVIIAAPQNLNPGLYVPLFDAEEFNQELLDSESPDPLTEPTTEDNIEASELEDSDSGLFSYLSDFTVRDLDIGYQQNFDNFGGFEYGIQPTLNFENSEGDRIGLTTGVEIFDQATTEQVLNVPLEVSWHHKIDQSSIDVSGGVDFFDRLPIAPRFSAGGATPLFKGATLSGVIEYEPYKFNAQTLENEIHALRFGPNLFWQIAPDTSLFSLVRVGTYNDGNTEQQSFSRLEHRIGTFGVAANLFNWVYRSNMEMSSGYFSPQDFLVYSGEIFWADNLFNYLDCRASASLGRQRLSGGWTSGYSYGGQCTIPITQDIMLDMNYAFSNVRDQMTGESAFNSNALTGSLRIDF